MESSNHVHTECCVGVDADVIILNTCHIREKARHKVVSRLGVLKEFKKKKPEMILAVAGCTAQAEGRRLLESVPFVDILMGPGRMSELPNLIQKAQSQKDTVVAIGFPKLVRELFWSFLFSFAY